jgi:CHASE2 domain-containing sensor protein
MRWAFSSVPLKMSCMPKGFDCGPTDKVARAVFTAVIALCVGAADARGQSDTERQSTSPHYLFVATSDEDAGRLGPWPLDRSVYATAIARAREDGARAVVLKFFFDRPSMPEADAKLADAVASMPVYLQFAFDGDDGKAEGQPVWRSDFGPENLKVFFHGSPSLLPLPLFRKNATGIGFVNVLPDPDYDRIEILGSTGVGAGIAASLQLLSIEADIGAQVSVREMRFSINGKSYEIGDDGRVRCPYLDVGRPREYSLFAFLDGQVPGDEVRDHVVVIGNTRHDTPRYPISRNASLPVHEVFFRQILCLDGLR